MLRLQKYIAQSGICSRRHAEELVLQGKVQINGKVVTQMGTRVDPAKDKVKVSGCLIKPREEKVYIVLHKPKGYETTCRRDKRAGEGRRRERRQRGKTILDLVKVPERIFPVGRLDKDSSGLLILTNDGEFANRMMHPRYEHEKEYIVDIARPLSQKEVRELEMGIRILGKVTSKAKVKVLSPRKVSMIIHEGMNRQIRRMLEAVGNKVIDLKRVKVGNIKLSNLHVGKWKRIKAPFSY